MADDGFRYELVRGELRKMPPSGHPHAGIAGDLAIHFGSHVKANKLGKVYVAEGGFVLETDPDHVRAPDVGFVRQARVDAAAGTQGFFPGPPDIAFEVISPNDLYTEVEEKVADYLAAGTLRVHRPLSDTVELAESDTLEVSDVVPGWRMPVGEMFE